MLEIIILSLIQGVTEFLPVSSSSHLIIVGKTTGYNLSNLYLDISLHIGSFLAVVIYFRNYILDLFSNRKILSLIIFSSIPIILAGFLIVSLDLIQFIRDVKLIAITTIIFGIILYISDKSKTEKKIEKSLNLKQALIIGVIHCLALIPGVSRSGIAITAARFLGYRRDEAAKISFLLSIPTLFAVSIFGLKNLYMKSQLNFENINFLGIFISFFFSYITIKFFLNYIKKFDLKIFVFYRILLGIFLLGFFL
tara:strand:+ start:4175 stop:4930 length:756 start_codon:yes stop_codon:yes gene_type:complete